MRRRCAVKKPKPRRAVRWLAALLALAWAVLAFCWYVEDRFEPILDELAEYEAKAAVVGAAQKAVAVELAAHPDRYAQLYRVQHNGTALTAVQADPAAMNKARLALAAAVDDALAVLPPVRTQVPFGTLTGFSLLNGLGPGWSLCFTPKAFTEGEIRENTETVGINTVRCSAVLELKITINMVLDGKNRMLFTTVSVPIASVAAGGETPLCYSAGP